MAVALLGLVIATTSRSTTVAEQLAAIYLPNRVESAALSPDGKFAALAVHQGRSLEIEIVDTLGLGRERRVTLDSAKAAIRFLGWVSPEVIVAVSDRGFVAIDAVHGATTPLVDRDTFARVVKGRRRRPAVRMLDVLPDDHRSIIAEATTSYGDYDDTDVELYRIDVTTGESRRIFARVLDPPGGSVIVDHQGQPRIVFARGVLPQTYTYRGAAEASWRRLDSVLPDSRGFAFPVTARNYLGARTIPLGFDFDGTTLYYGSNLGRQTYRIRAVDLRTARPLPLQVDDPNFDLVGIEQPWRSSPLVFDRARRSLVGVRYPGLRPTTVWLDEDLAAVQSALARDFPGRDPEILEWDAARERFLVLVASLATPGRYFVYRKSSRSYLYLASRARLAADEINPTEPFTFQTRDGSPVTGYLTLPHAPPVARPALVIWFHDGPWQRVPPAFQRDAQALAAMGFAVAEINYRGSGGFGRAFRESIGADFAQPAIDDAVAAQTWLAAHYNLDLKRTAVAGEGFGAFLALRTAEDHADRFRATVAINAVLDFDRMKNSTADIEARKIGVAPLEAQGVGDLQRLTGNPSRTNPFERAAQDAEDYNEAMRRRNEAMVDLWMSIPPSPVDMTHEASRQVFRGWFADRFSVPHLADKLVRPVLLIHDAEGSRYAIGPVRELRAAIAARGVPVEYQEVGALFDAGPPISRAPAFVHIGEFLNASLYDFHVKIGKVVEKD